MTDTRVSTITNILLAAVHAFNDQHEALGSALLVEAEARVALVDDPLQYLKFMNMCDKLWRTHLVNSELKPKGMVEDQMNWQQLDLPFGGN